MERHLFRKRNENNLMKFISLPFALIGCVVVLEFLGSDAPILESTPEQLPHQVMEIFNSIYDDVVSSGFGTF